MQGDGDWGMGSGTAIGLGGSVEWSGVRHS